MFLQVSRKATLTDEVISNLLQAHKTMAIAEEVDVKGLIALSRYLLRLIQKGDDELVGVILQKNEDGGHNLCG